MTDISALDDEAFWAWLCAEHGWQPDREAWIKEHCPRLHGEDDDAYIARTRGIFSKIEPLDRELYNNLVHFIAIACDIEVLASPAIAERATEASQQAEKDLYATGWSLEEIAEVCRRQTAKMQFSVYKPWAITELSQTS
jgi:hypothetical protein